MKRILFVIAFAAGAFAAHAQDITGTWSGNADLGVQKLPIVFHIEKSDDGYSVTMDSPMQGAKGIPVSSVTFGRDTLRISITQIAFVYTGVLNGDAIKGSFTQGGVSFPLDLERVGNVVVNRPQEPVPPYPYRSEDVVFGNTEAGIELSGTLTMPAGGKKFPAVVLLTGSGAQNRDEELFGHKPFLVLADHLTRRGIAVLRFDDRGVGGSGGDFTTAATADFATDAAAAVRYLGTRKEIDSRKIGLAGHSEGSMTAFMTAAARPEEIAFVVSMAGMGVRGDSISVTQAGHAVRRQGFPQQVVRMQMATQRKLLDMVSATTPEYFAEHIDDIAGEAVPGYAVLPENVKEQARIQLLSLNSPWTRFFFSHEPAGDIGRTRCPVLALNGERDTQVLSSVNLPAIGEALEKGGNTRFTLVEYPDLNHLFQRSVTGNSDEYGEIEETFSPRAMEDIAAWIIKVTE